MNSTIPIQIGDMQLLVETAPVVGSQATSNVADKAVARFADAQEAIVEVATSVVGSIRRTAERTAQPDHVEVTFGLKFSAEGNVIVAGAKAEASLQVKLTYDKKS